MSTLTARWCSEIAAWTGAKRASRQRFRISRCCLAYGSGCEGTLRISEEGGSPILAIEITSMSTYDHDIHVKPYIYFHAGVSRYLILDRGRKTENPLRLKGFDRGPHGWQPMTPDALGRLDLAPVPFLIGVENDRPRFYDSVTGEPIPGRTELKDLRLAAETRARDEAKARANAEAKARDEAKARADAEAANVALAKRLRDLEELLRQRGES